MVLLCFLKISPVRSVTFSKGLYNRAYRFPHGRPARPEKPVGTLLHLHGELDAGGSLRIYPINEIYRLNTWTHLRLNSPRRRTSKIGNNGDL